MYPPFFRTLLPRLATFLTKVDSFPFFLPAWFYLPLPYVVFRIHSFLSKSTNCFCLRRFFPPPPPLVLRLLSISSNLMEERSARPIPNQLSPPPFDHLYSQAPREASLDPDPETAQTVILMFPFFALRSRLSLGARSVCLPEFDGSDFSPIIRSLFSFFPERCRPSRLLLILPSYFPRALSYL